MPTTRRELLGVGASLAAGVLPLIHGSGAIAQGAAGASASDQAGWDAGDLDHLLPTSSHDRILLKASFKRQLDSPPVLLTGDERITGERTDTRGTFWQFQVSDLKAGTVHHLSLMTSDGRPLCQPWTLSTLPAPDDRPEKLRLLVYSCAGGHDLFAKAHTNFEFLPAAVRQRLLKRALSFAPNALIANGDHVYWDLLAPRAAPKLGGSQ